METKTKNKTKYNNNKGRKLKKELLRRHEGLEKYLKNIYKL